MSIKNLQETLDEMDVARLKFAGMAVDTLADPPDLYEEIEGTFTGTVIGYSIEKMKDKEERLVAKIDVTGIKIGGKDVKTSAQPTLDEAGQDDEGDTEADPDDPGF